MVLAAVEAVTEADPVREPRRHNSDIAAQAAARESLHAASPCPGSKRTTRLERAASAWEAYSASLFPHGCAKRAEDVRASRSDSELPTDLGGGRLARPSVDTARGAHQAVLRRRSVTRKLCPAAPTHMAPLAKSAGVGDPMDQHDRDEPSQSTASPTPAGAGSAVAVEQQRVAVGIVPAEFPCSPCRVLYVPIGKHR